MFVLDDDKPFFVMPGCYYPTTVLAVDDERQFLDALKLKVFDHLSLASLSHVQLAKITDITNHHRPEKLGFSFRETCLS